MNIEKTINTILEHSRESEIDYDIFEKFFLDELKTKYNEMDIYSFAEKAYSAWKLLPDSINQMEPFWTLLYADDPLSWGDEKQTREIYEKCLDIMKTMEDDVEDTLKNDFL